jgi:uncharacterized membrane protein YoaK (UPF0700 family)
MTEQQAWWSPAVQLFLRVWSYILVPAVSALLANNYIKKHAYPSWLVLIVVAIAFALTVLGIWHELKKFKSQNKNVPS